MVEAGKIIDEKRPSSDLVGGCRFAAGSLTVGHRTVSKVSSPPVVGR